MTLGPNPFNPSPTLPTLADIQRRCGELLAYQNRHKSAQAPATPAKRPAEEDLRLLEEFTQKQEDQQESAEFQDPYAVEDPTAQRIGQALDVAPEGLTRMQIRALFHRHVSKERIDLALEQLLKLGLINQGTTAGRGRATNLWTRPQNPETSATPRETGPYGA